jgi:hypothetical protein
MSHSGAVDALADNRRLVVGLALASGVAGQVPIPVVSTLAQAGVRALLIRMLAGRRGVELDSCAAVLIATSPERKELGSAVTSVGLRLVWRPVARALFILYRVDDIARTFVLGTQFDYYCIALHPGTALDRRGAEAVAEALCQAGQHPGRRVMAALFAKAVSDLLMASQALPRALWDLAAQVLGSEDESEVEQVVEQDPGGVVSRLTRLIERELGDAGRVSLEALCDALEQAWSLKSTDGIAVEGGAK